METMDKSPMSISEAPIYCLAFSKRKVIHAVGFSEATQMFERYASPNRSARTYKPVPVIDTDIGEVVACFGMNGRLMRREECHGKTPDKLDFDLMMDRHWRPLVDSVMEMDF